MGRIRFVAGLVLAVFVLAVSVACDNASTSTSTTASGGEPQEMTWERLVEIVREGQVEAVFQYHSLRVEVHLVDGTQYWATEPQIDAILRVVEEAPNRDSIVIATE